MNDTKADDDHPGRKPDALLKDLNPEAVAAEMVAVFILRREEHLATIRAMQAQLLGPPAASAGRTMKAPDPDPRDTPLWKLMCELTRFAQTGELSVTRAKLKEQLNALCEAFFKESPAHATVDVTADGSWTAPFVVLASANARLDLHVGRDVLFQHLYLLASVPFEEQPTRAKLMAVLYLLDSRFHSAQLAWLAARGVPGFTKDG